MQYNKFITGISRKAVEYMEGKSRLRPNLVWIMPIVLIALIVLTFIYGNSKPFVRQYVIRHQDELDSFVAAAYANIPADNYERFIPLEYNNWSAVICTEEDNVVLFCVYEAGFASSSTYKGFAYSPNDVPVGFYGRIDGFERNDDGSWISYYQGEYNYCEKMLDKWYYFKVVT